MKTHLRPSPLRSSRSNTAFSLVEVVMAVAIAALGIVTVMGLIPHGLEMSRKTGNEIAMTRIIQTIAAEVQQADWTQMDADGGQLEGTRTFDDQGLEVEGSDLFVTYVADVEIPALDVVLPTNREGVHQNIRRVVVRVAAANDADFDFDNAPFRSYRTFTQLVARTR